MALEGSSEVPAIDFEVQNHGTLFLLRPLTDAAIVWVEEHLPEDAFTFGRAIVVTGIQRDGLAVR